MRDLLNQNRPLSPATLQLGTTVMTILFGVAAVLIFLFGFLNLLRPSTFLVGLLQISGGLGFLLAVTLIVRLLSENVMAQHRLNDRLLILSDTLASRRVQTPKTASPAPAKKASKPATRKAKPAAKPSQAEAPAPAAKPKAEPDTPAAEKPEA